MKYNLKSIMHTAWNLFRKGAESFAAALRMAWAGWKELGYEVIHESKALYRVALYDPATKNGTRTTCYFGESQVQPKKV